MQQIYLSINFDLLPLMKDPMWHIQERIYQHSTNWGTKMTIYPKYDLIFISPIFNHCKHNIMINTYKNRKKKHKLKQKYWLINIICVYYFEMSNLIVPYPKYETQTKMYCH